MEQATYIEQMQTLIIICRALIGGYHNHEHRNQRLYAIQALIADWRRTLSNSIYDGDVQQRHDRVLRACYDLSTPWQLGSVTTETHHGMKTRLRLIVEICESEIEEIKLTDRTDRHEFPRQQVDLPF